MSSDSYYIVFIESERKQWYLRWLKEGFSHCFLLKPEDGKWVKYETGNRETRIDIITDYTEYLKNGIMVKIEAKTAKRWILVNTCVSLVKLITGVGGLSLTPYQLYKRVK